MTIQDVDVLRQNVRAHDAGAALEAAEGTALDEAGGLGAAQYAPDQLGELPLTAVSASPGCGDPTLLAQLKPGQVVLDLGFGGGIDVLLSAKRVGPTGRAYGLDMTDEMLDLAGRNAAEAGATNVEFLRGDIEAIPLPDASIDVIISNRVVNLSGDKQSVLAEAFRVLRPGGRLAISDFVLTRHLAPPLAAIGAAVSGCVAGAFVRDDLEASLAAAGFLEVSVEPSQVFGRAELEPLAPQLDPSLIPAGLDPGIAVAALDGAVTTSFIRARKPSEPRPGPQRDGMAHTAE